MDHDLEQVRRFLRILTGDENTPVTWQVFYDPKDGNKRPDLAKHFTGTLNDNIDYFKYAQSKYCGIYVGINKTDGQGRKNENITEYRACFADFDGIAEPEWVIEPHMVQKRDDTHGHAFWLIEGVNDAEEWQILQKRIAIYYNTDHQVYDPARVVRVSGFNHYKNPNNPCQYVITHESDADYYTVEDILALTPLDATQDAELNQWVEGRKALLTGTGYEDDSRYVEQTKNWLINTAPPAYEGSGSETVYKVAAYGHDYGISLPLMSSLMWEHYNPRCVPPWDYREQQHFLDIIERAYTYPKSAAGCKTAIAGFSSLPEIPEPTEGWEANAKRKKPDLPTVTVDAINIEDDGRLNSTEAAISLGQLNLKSSHYDLARAFDGVTFNGSDVIRCEGICYKFNGRNWEVISDEVVKARVLRFYSELKPNDTWVSGVTKMFFTLINVTEVENCQWLNDDKRDPSKILVFKNGMVYTEGKFDTWELEPHDRNFFTFNSLDYDFDKNAQCPNFMSFIDSIWGDQQGMLLQLRDSLAYMMTPDNSLQKMFAMVGKSRGGKGVLTRLIARLVGEHNVAAPMLSKIHTDHVLEKFSRSTLALIPDAHNVPYNSRDNVLSALKLITGNDPVTFDVKFKPSQTVTVVTRLLLSTNNMPEFNDPSGALANRLVVFNFTKSFAGREDVTLDRRLQNEIKGIANWALSGLDDLRARGNIFEAESGLAEKAELKEDMFPLAKFVNECCQLDETLQCHTEDLYHAYRFWCTANGIKQPMTELGFSKCLANSDLPIVKKSPRINGVQKRGFVGIYAKQDPVSNVVNFPEVPVNE